MYVCASPHSSNSTLAMPAHACAFADKKDEGSALAVCKFDTLDADAYKQYGMKSAHADSDDSDG